MKQFFLVLLFFLVSSNLRSQYLFSEKFEGCDTKLFALEKDTTKARIDNDLFFSEFKKGLKTKKKIKGELWLQIIVYKDGTSCLLSIENKTNIKTQDFNLQSTMQRLQWNNPKENISVLARVLFKDGDIALVRYGSKGPIIDVGNKSKVTIIPKNM